MEEVNNKTKIYNNEVIWLSYQPGAGGDFIMGTLFNLPESNLLWQKINRYGSYYLDSSVNNSLPFCSVSFVESNEDVNKVKKYIDNTELCCISSHSSPNLIYPLLEKPVELTYIYIYPDSLAIMEYMETLSIIKNHIMLTPTGAPSPIGIGHRLEKIQEKLSAWHLGRDSMIEAYKKYEKLSFLPNTFMITYKSFFIDCKPDILKKLIDIYNADITVEEFSLKIKEYHNKNLKLIETIDKEL